MPASEVDDAIIPVLSCTSLPEMLAFYRALGFQVTHEQTKPYVWGAVQRGRVQIHFTRGKAAAAPGLCLVMVREVEDLHRSFVEGLKRQYGKLPLAGAPRITRLRKEGTRIMAVDPAGNSLLFISRSEPPATYDEDPAEWEALSPLAQALRNAVWLRDLKGHDDAAAAKVLDVALARHAHEPAVDYARVLAARAELALALGDTERSRALREELRRVPLSAEERAQFREELEAADELERLLG